VPSLSAPKRLATSLLYPVGSVRTVMFGPCRGLRLMAFEGYALGYFWGRREREEMQVMMQLIQATSVVYDVGANYGMHTLLMAKLANTSGHVYAFEPVHELASEVAANLSLNNFRNATVVRKAVSKSVGKAFFDATPGTAVGHLATDGNLEVETTSLDAFVFDQGNRAPDLIKIDIEGAESQALEGAMRLLQEHRPALLIELHTPEQDRAVGRILKYLGYGARRLRPAEAVLNLDSGWPDPAGPWGTILATA
jgi:FkbM family methyltransferase